METHFDVWFVVIVGTMVMVFFAGALVLSVLISKRRELMAKQRELERVAASEKKYRDLFENSPAGMVRYSVAEKKIIDANDALLCMLQTDTNDGVTALLNTVPPAIREEVWKKLSAGGSVKNEEYYMHRDEGPEIWISFSAKYIPERGIIEGVIIDISKRKHAELQVYEQADLLNKTHDAVLVLTFARMIRYWNKSAETMFGWSAENAIGKSITNIISSCSEPAFDAAWTTAMSTGSWSGDMRQHLSENKERVLFCRFSLVRNQQGQATDMMIVSTDVTEIRRLQERFLRTQRIESIGVLTSGIAHDLSNDFAPVIMGIETVKEHLNNEMLQPVIAAMELSTRHAKNMVEQVLSFVKGAEGNRVELNPVMVLSEVRKVVETTFPSSIRLEVHIAEDIQNILGDVGQLHQVFLNLLKNARDAMPDGGTITITAVKAVLDQEAADSIPDAEQGEYMLFTFQDAGCGIPPEDMEKIFEPFYTTKEIGKGTGLGLSNAMGIVKGHKGFMTADSAPGTGSTFSVYLPVCQPEKELAVK